MIHKADALAALDESLRGTEQSELLIAMGNAAREILEALFEGRDSLPLSEARVQNNILTLASIGMLGAISAALNAGDRDEEPVAQ